MRERDGDGDGVGGRNVSSCSSGVQAKTTIGVDIRIDRKNRIEKGVEGRRRRKGGMYLPFYQLQYDILWTRGHFKSLLKLILKHRGLLPALRSMKEFVLQGYYDRILIQQQQQQQQQQ